MIWTEANPYWISNRDWINSDRVLQDPDALGVPVSVYKDSTFLVRGFSLQDIIDHGTLIAVLGSWVNTDYSGVIQRI